MLIINFNKTEYKILTSVGWMEVGYFYQNVAVDKFHISVVESCWETVCQQLKKWNNKSQVNKTCLEIGYVKLPNGSMWIWHVFPFFMPKSCT